MQGKRCLAVVCLFSVTALTECLAVTSSRAFAPCVLCFEQCSTAPLQVFPSPILAIWVYFEVQK
jgi:hypothetical protein